MFNSQKIYKQAITNCNYQLGQRFLFSISLNLLLIKIIMDFTIKKIKPTKCIQGLRLGVSRAEEKKPNFHDFFGWFRKYLLKINTHTQKDLLKF